jgi:hypothetical protein
MPSKFGVVDTGQAEHLHARDAWPQSLPSMV